MGAQQLSRLNIMGASSGALSLARGGVLAEGLSDFHCYWYGLKCPTEGFDLTANVVSDDRPVAQFQAPMRYIHAPPTVVQMRSTGMDMMKAVLNHSDGGT